MKRDHVRSIVSIMLLGVFVLLAGGSDDEYDQSEPITTYIGEGVYQETKLHDFGDGDETVYIRTGPRDNKGRWHGRVQRKKCEGCPIEEAADYQHGERHGWTVYYSYGVIKNTEYYEHGRLADPPEGQQPQQSIGTITGRESSASTAKSYQKLEQARPWFIHEMEQPFGISNDQVNTFMAEIEARIAAAAPQGEEDLIEAFNAAIEEIGEIQQYAGVIQAYNVIRYREARDRLKSTELRLAIFDRIFRNGSSTFEILETSYPAFLQQIVADGADLDGIEASLDDMDDRMDAMGPLDLNDPLVAEAIDTRIQTVLQEMSQMPEYQTSEMIYRPAPGLNDGTDDGSENAGKDSYAWSCNGEYSGSSVFMVGLPRSTCNQCSAKGYVQFNLATLPSTVQNVYLGVTHYPHDVSCSSMCNANFYFYPVLDPWNEMTIGSGSEPAEGTPVLGPLHIAFPNNFGAKEYDITDIYRSWKDGTIPNNGLAIYSPDSGCVNAAVMFNVHSSDDPDPSLRPYLKIVYGNPVFSSFYKSLLYTYTTSDPVFLAVGGGQSESFQIGTEPGLVQESVEADNVLELMINSTNTHGDTPVYEWLYFTGTIGGNPIPLSLLSGKGIFRVSEVMANRNDYTFTFDADDLTSIAKLPLAKLGLRTGDYLTYGYAYQNLSGKIVVDNVVWITVK